jgi:hypothetical protein
MAKHSGRYYMQTNYDTPECFPFSNKRIYYVEFKLIYNAYHPIFFFITTIFFDRL